MKFPKIHKFKQNGTTEYKRCGVSCIACTGSAVTSLVAVAVSAVTARLCYPVKINDRNWLRIPNDKNYTASENQSQILFRLSVLIPTFQGVQL